VHKGLEPVDGGPETEPGLWMRRRPSLSWQAAEAVENGPRHVDDGAENS
jgi:hypothetical protein